MDEDLELTVSSELYAEKNYTCSSKPLCNKNNNVSKFSFHLPPTLPHYDSDGDLIVERKAIQEHNHCIEIEYTHRTVLDLVGLQIWRGALLLADWLIYNSKSFSNNDKFLELGSGVGITSIVAAMIAPVVCTDVNKGGILELIQSNVVRNQAYTKNQVLVMELDFYLPFSKEIQTVLPSITTILAADVIYDNDITDAFIQTLIRLLAYPPSKEIIIALEKRFVFTVEDLDSVAPCYEYFLNGLSKLQKLKGVTIQEIPIDFPQYFDYKRVKELTMWKICSNLN